MKLRLMGPPDIIELWAARFAELGIGGRTYPSRYGDGQLRWYGEIDDRIAASIALVSTHKTGDSIISRSPASSVQPSVIVSPERPTRRRRRP